MQDEEEAGQPSFLKDKQLDEYIKTVMGHLRTCQAHSSELQGWHMYKDYVGVRRTIEQVNSSISTLISKIFLHQDIKLKLTNVKLTDQFDMLREGNDALLERINSEVDEASGLKKDIDMEPVIKKVQTPASSTGDGRSVLLIGSKNVQKPQLSFKEKINNSAKEPFIPLIKEKPNSIKPLAILICLDSMGREYYNHPYEYELLHWSPAPKLLEPVKPISAKPLSETTITIVDKVEVLESVVEELKKCTEIAVDLEHHSFRSYQGLTCLIQLSTRTKDYLIDPLALRGQLTILNEVFTDPKITKVLHGADFDVLWLQRDCGVYIVNLFDTHQAAIVLEYPHRSLAALLAKFCGIQANKIYQRADWRIRPLPEDFVEYARQDSHFLLYIYDLMRNELIERGNQLNNLITAVYTRSTEICMSRYEKPIVGPESHMDLYRRSRKAFDSKQMFALRELYLWRDKVAREQDESTDYVLPKHMLLQISEVLPKEMQGILACCNPIPPLVKTELLTLHSIIRLAREQKHIPAPEASAEGKLPLGQLQMEDINPGLVISKHDLSTVEENPRDMPTLLNPSETLLGNLFTQTKVDVQLLFKSKMFACNKNKLKHTDLVQSKVTSEFMSPYQRYTAYLEMKPLLEGEKKKDKGQEDQEHIDRVKEHFMSLTNNTPVQNPVKETKQEPAMLKPVEMETLEETVPLVLSDEVAKVREAKRMMSSAKKRPSDGNEVSPSKRLKAEEGEEQQTPTDGASQSDSTDEPTQADNSREDKDSSEPMGDVKAFDYEKANYRMFKPSNPRGGKKFKDDRFKTHGKFKPEGNDRGRGGKSDRGREGFKARGNHRGGHGQGRGDFAQGRGGFGQGRGGFGQGRGGRGTGRGRGGGGGRGMGRGRGRGGF